MTVFGEQSKVEMPLDIKKEKTVKKIKETVDQFESRIKDRYYFLVKLVWENPSGLTPQEVFDALGTDAGTLVDLSNGLKKLLSDADEGYEAPVFPNKIDINEDNTVTLS